MDVLNLNLMINDCIQKTLFNGNGVSPAAAVAIRIFYNLFLLPFVIYFSIESKYSLSKTYILKLFFCQKHLM